MDTPPYIEISPIEFDEEHRQSIIMAMNERWPIIYRNSDGTEFARMLPNDDSAYDKEDQPRLSDEKG